MMKWGNDASKTSVKLGSKKQKKYQKRKRMKKEKKGNIKSQEKRFQKKKKKKKREISSLGIFYKDYKAWGCLYCVWIMQLIQNEM